MEKIFEQNLLYDFYGELLNDHQREVYESAVFEDLSLKELSEEYGMTRQGVHDLIKRCDKSLSEYESKLHMAEKYARIRNMVLQMKELAEDKDNNGSKISSIATELLEIL